MSIVNSHVQTARAIRLHMVANSASHVTIFNMTAVVPSQTSTVLIIPGSCVINTCTVVRHIFTNKIIFPIDLHVFLTLRYFVLFLKFLVLLYENNTVKSEIDLSTCRYFYHGDGTRSLRDACVSN